MLSIMSFFKSNKSISIVIILMLVVFTLITANSFYNSISNSLTKDANTHNAIIAVKANEQVNRIVKINEDNINKDKIEKVILETSKDLIDKKIDSDLKTTAIVENTIEKIHNVSSIDLNKVENDKLVVSYLDSVWNVYNMVK